jgi:hypothetical protein
MMKKKRQQAGMIDHFGRCWIEEKTGLVQVQLVSV